MPFSETPTRNAGQLAAFFHNHLKLPIEAQLHLANTYSVDRSGDTFEITAQIIKDLYAADVVICDLSGSRANPNVMYELGIRLAVSNGPVVLIREQQSDNRPIFDIGGFYAEPYDPLNCAPITTHVLNKLGAFETGQEAYQSPVLKILEQDQPLIQRIGTGRAAFLLNTLARSLRSTARLFAGSIVDFALRQSNLDLTGDATPEGVLQEMQSQFVAVKKLKWERFHFRLGAQPAVEHYLSAPYLATVVPEPIESMVSNSITEYYTQYLAGDYLWYATPLETAHHFLGETIICSAIARATAVLVASNVESERGSILSSIVQMVDELKRSRATFVESYEGDGSLTKKPRSGAARAGRSTERRGSRSKNSPKN